MERDRNILMEKYLHLSMLLKRLSAANFGVEGPRGRSQARALTQIALRDGITQRELMEKLGIQPSSMSELLSKLERSGLIERHTGEEDHRLVNLYISESGRKYLERVNDADRMLIPFDSLNEEEEEKLDAILDKLIASAENACADQGLNLFPPRPRPFNPAPPFRGRPPFGSPRDGEHPDFGGQPPCPGRRPHGIGPEEGVGSPEEPDRGFRPGCRPRPPFPRPSRLPNLRPRPNGEAPYKSMELADSATKKDEDGLQKI